MSDQDAFEDALEQIRLASEVLMNQSLNQWPRAWALTGVRDFLMGKDPGEGFHTAEEWGKGYEDHYLRGYNSAKNRTI